MTLFTRKRAEVPTAETALPDRDEPIESNFASHLVLDTSITPSFPQDTDRAVFGMGCFWGADRPIGFESHTQ